MKIPRILLAAGASGSGKTLITCGLLQALVNRGLKVASFKCGPDYIDPMFHSRVIGTRSRNLDTFFTDGDRTRYLLAKNASDCEIAVMEGVMGYYDGVGGITSRASAYDLASTTDTPVILIVNSRGMSVSLAAYVKGFLEYKKDSHICGVIFNQMSPMLYPRMKKLLEEELSVKVLGYVPKVEDCVIESRHLGLVLPEEIPELKSRLQKLSEVLEKTLDIDGILELAGEAPELAAPETEMLIQKDTAFGYRTEEKVRIGVADDEAFCFFYADNLNLLEQMGAELVRFSPIHDRELPEDLDGLLLSGGYPELNGEALEENQEMCTRIREVILDGMPCLAECGGFMYLHQEMEDMEGKQRRVCGVIPGRAYRTPKLNRFGYITLTEKQDTGLGEIPAHEFHYFDSTDCGEDFHAAKPASKRGWDCIHDRGRLMAGFPHLYYYGNPRVPARFLKNALEYKKERRQKKMLKYSLPALVIGFVLDLLIGDPRWLYHPICVIGNLIAVLEKVIRKIFPKNHGGELTGGFLIVVLVCLFSGGVPLLVLYYLYRYLPVAGFVLEVFWCYQLLATRSLKDESMKVYDRLKNGTLDEARYAVSMIVGRDTRELTETGVTKAAVETVAENASDGVIAPMFYMAIGGVPLMFLYKGINTMDSMLGYKNDKYLYFGRIAAKLDDVANYIPARISGWLMVAGTVFTGMDTKNAAKIYKRDRRNHASPNSAQTEAAMAGALDVQLAGNAYYFGKLYEKPTIGDPIRPVEPEDIKRANRLMYAASILGVVVFGLLSAGSGSGY